MGVANAGGNRAVGVLQAVGLGQIKPQGIAYGGSEGRGKDWAAGL